MATALQGEFDVFEALVPSGDVGGGGRLFRGKLLEALETGYQRVVVDCTAWRRLDFGLLSALVRSADAFRTQGAMLELVNVSPEISADIRALRLDRRLGL
jgi:anti-anti-sigma regulatory factor